MAQQAGYSRSTTYTLLFLFKVRLETYYLLYGAAPDKDCNRKPQNLMCHVCLSRSFFRLKTEESIHITHIVEAIEDIEVKEAVKQPVKEAVRNSRSKKLCQTAKPELLKATTPFSKKLLGNSRSKKL